MTRKSDELRGSTAARAGASRRSGRPATATPRGADGRAPDPSSPAGRRRLRLVENKRSAILEAALDCFSLRGLHGTSVDEIAARADVSKSNLLYYFSSKEELYVAVLKNLLTLWLAPLEAFEEAQDPVGAIKEYIRLKLLISRDHPRASRLFCLEMIEGAPLLRTELEHSLREIVEAKSEVIRSWIDSGRLRRVDPHHLIFSLWAITQHYADFSIQVQAVSGRTLEDRAFFEQTLANVQLIVLQGVGADDTPTS